eukprot:TRINITY_DN41019_c0_g1_i1.p1 TRINITY_DN41019_c0_g1~~TRINITY_DN41019_c0_g1_i1.p1  ORF type:complete len:115 (+),score=26.25 TRINITY_DN41019_c0_g1_i1:148-492(+)
MSPPLRTAFQKIGNRFVFRRAFSQESGKVLSEEEKAAENVYIKKMEQEKLEKLARKGVPPEEQKAGNTTGSQSTSEGVSTDKAKNYAVVSGVVALVAGVWWYVKATSKKPEPQD